MIESLLLTFHIVLFGIKLWAVIIFSEHIKKYKYMFLWSMIYLIIETWFLHKFFLDMDLYYYEILAIIDQCIFTVGLVFYLTKEVDNGERTN